MQNRGRKDVNLWKYLVHLDTSVHVNRLIQVSISEINLTVLGNPVVSGIGSPVKQKNPTFVGLHVGWRGG